MVEGGKQESTDEVLSNIKKLEAMENELRQKCEVYDKQMADFKRLQSEHDDEVAKKIAAIKSDEDKVKKMFGCKNEEEAFEKIVLEINKLRTIFEAFTGAKEGFVQMVDSIVNARNVLRSNK